MACARLLLEDAGLAVSGAREDLGMALGTATAGLDSVVEYLGGLIDQGPGGVPAILFSNTVANAPASLCAIEFGLRGPNVTFNQREASSLSAVHFSVAAIRDRRASAMITGGAESIEETYFKVHDRFHALAPMRVTAPNGADEIARPFDVRRNGCVLGEGGFLLLLESATAAAARGARAYGEILGVGATSSKSPANGWPEEHGGLANAMRLALADAKLAPGDVSAVIAASNGSPRLDLLEATAIVDVFGAAPVPVMSLKGAIGESGAAGAAGLLAGLLSVPSGSIGPTAGFAQPDPACAVSVSCRAQTVGGHTFVVNSVAAGGAIYSVVVRAGRS